MVAEYRADEFLKAWVARWQTIKGEKPDNNQDFISVFTKWLEKIPAEHFSFSGENGYCGYTATVTESFNGYSHSLLDFEFAYRDKGSDNFVKVFTLHHNGFWTPEYIDLKGPNARVLLSLLNKKLIDWAGFEIPKF